MKTELSLSKSKQQKLRLYECLDKEDKVTELRARSIKFSCTESKKSLSGKLGEAVHGIQRVPALTFYNRTSNLADINLDLYEVLFAESLHDILNHIQNLYAELQFQMEKEYIKSFTDIINVSFNGKIAKNCSGYRKSILIVTK